MTFHHSLLLGVAAVAAMTFTYAPTISSAQGHDTGSFVPYENTFEQELKSKIGAATPSTSAKPPLAFKMDVSGMALPQSPEEFQQAWHFPPQSQDLTGSCWSFSSISFFESEIFRIHGRKVKLSEMFTVYWEYVEKAREFVRTRGASNFTRGSQANATVRMWKQYGVAPIEAYGGFCPGMDIHDDRGMFDKMKAALADAKTRGEWDEEKILKDIRAILDEHMTPPPAKFEYEGKTITPVEFLRDVVALPLDDYVCVMSLKEKPFHEKVEYEVTDNWWRSAEYYNVPLDEFMAAVKRAARAGYSLGIVGDNSEPGFLPAHNVALIPDFDIPAAAIDDDARQMRFTNEATTDDHAIHLVGWMERDGHDWYLIKDSGTRSRMGAVKGYMFYREDFVALKMMYIMGHKDVLEEGKLKAKTKNEKVKTE